MTASRLTTCVGVSIIAVGTALSVLTAHNQARAVPTSLHPQLGRAVAIPADPLSEPTAVSVPYSGTVPAFPALIPEYQLKAPAQRYVVRLFKGAKWHALPPVDKGLAGNCEQGFWIVRWRSGNPTAAIDAAIGDTAFPGFNKMTRASRGAAGYATGNACVSPGLRLAGRGVGIVDINYEVQIWLYKPAI